MLLLWILLPLVALYCAGYIFMWLDQRRHVLPKDLLELGKREQFLHSEPKKTDDLEEIRSAINKKSDALFKFEVSATTCPDGNCNLSGPERLTRRNLARAIKNRLKSGALTHLRFSGAPRVPKSSFNISNLVIDTLEFNQFENPASIFVTNCAVAKILIGGNVGNVTQLILENTLCDSIQVSLSPERIVVKNSTIGNTIIHNLDKEILKAITVDTRSTLGASHSTFEKTDLSDYIKLRDTVKDLGDVPSARELHAQILRMGRKHDLWSQRLLGAIYDLTCGYGTRPMRPLVWIAAIAVACFLTVWATDGAVFLKQNQCNDTSQIATWEHQLCSDENDSKQWLRAATLTVRAIVNPLGFAARSETVAAASAGINVLLFYQWLLTLILIALFILCVRGRFKLG